MKRIVLLAIAMSFPFTFFFSENADASGVMTDYCVVPPYVIQNTAPNVILLIDNSNSMYNFASVCTETQTSQNSPSANFTPQAVYVKSTSGFKVGDQILVWDSKHGAGSNYWRGRSDDGNGGYMKISSIDKAANSFTVVNDPSGSPASLHYDANMPVVKTSCIYTAGLYDDNHWDKSFSSSTSYYGYFHPDYYYTYGSSKFTPTVKKASRAKAAAEWDGNFLNWLTMRREDVLRKVLTGGRESSSKLEVIKADIDDRGIYKVATNVQNYVDTTYSGTRCFLVPSGSGNAFFNVGDSVNCNGTFDNKDYSLSVETLPGEVIEGVLQDLVGTKARLGLSFFNTNDEGGYVQTSIGGSSLSSVVNQINNTAPNANSPMAEALWSVVGYYEQQSSLLGGPGPMYKNGDYQTNASNDPLNYGSGGNPRYPSCAKSFVVFITDGDPCADGQLPASLRDYASGRSSYNCSGSGCPSVSSISAQTLPSCSAGGNLAGIEDVALYAHTNDLRSDITGTQNLTLYVINTAGVNSSSSTLLKYAAINGGFEDSNGNNIPDIQSEWNKNGDTDANGEPNPDTYYSADNGYQLEQALRDAFSGILARASSGTAASVLASGEGSGANLVQAVFYPRRRFGNDVVGWTGVLQNLWYYVDPLFFNSNIREDTVQETPDRKLNLVDDYIAQLYFDTTVQQTKARRYQDTNGDGTADVTEPTVNIESLGNIWEAGNTLWSRDPATRTIYMPSSVTGTSPASKLDLFTTGNAALILPYLDLPTSGDLNFDGWIDGNLNHNSPETVDAADAAILIRYVRGEDIDLNGNGIYDYRPRTVTIGSSTNVWRLGDILNSTPKISSWLPLHTYDKSYGDNSYASYVKSSIYTNRGMVFAGGNDGMLHAFKLGHLELPGQTDIPVSCTFATNDKACLHNTDVSTPLGYEAWAFIPKNVFPYLRYAMDPDYCHIYSVDLSPYIIDTSIGDTGCTETNYWDCSKYDASDVPISPATNRWKTILIGGMRYGGACRNSTGSCSSTTDGLPDCVKTPIAGVGYSSYFALDITDQNSPQLLWEFSNASLGFATTGPSVVRIGSDTKKNGRWFVVFGSGPTGPIKTTDQQFMGHSDQSLKLFVLDLKTGALLRTFGDSEINIPNAFAGSMLNSSHDANIDYQDDVIYVPYVKKCTSSVTDLCVVNTWTNGGVGRIVTKQSTDPADWVWKILYDNGGAGIGPVTSAVAKLQNNRTHALWLFFGTGRYFYQTTDLSGNAVWDDGETKRRLYGIKEPCFTSSNTFDPACNSQFTGTLTDVTTNANASPTDGWILYLDNCTNASGTEVNCTDATVAYKTERVITDLLATTSGVIFFTTYKPYTDQCSIGGKSYIWATKYNTGGAAGSLLKGKALLQVSTGSIEQMDLSTAFSDKGGRRSPQLEGVPPTAQGLSLISTPPPVKRIMHIRER